MKLYTTEKGHWAGTQADARKLTKEHGIPWELYEVPVAKQELLAFLNKHIVITRPIWPDSAAGTSAAREAGGHHSGIRCPSLGEVRKKHPDMTGGGYRSYKYGWDRIAK